MISETYRNGVMRVLVASLIIDMLAFTSILPLYPSIMRYYSKEGRRDFLYDGIVNALTSFQRFIGAPQTDKYNNVFFGGLLSSLFSALQFVSSPTLGALSDVHGRRRILLLSTVGTMISYILWLKADTFSVFVVSRIIGGLSKANVNVATAIISDIFPQDQHPKGMAAIGISYSVGFLVGPMIGAYFARGLSEENVINAPATFAIVLTIIEFLVIAFFMPETMEQKQQKAVEDAEKRAKDLISPIRLFRFEAVAVPIEKRAEMQKFGIVYFLYLFLYSGLEFTLPFLTHMRFNYGSMEQGKLYLYTGFIMLPLQGGYVRKVPMHKQKQLAEYGIMFAIPAFLLIAGAQTTTLMYIGLAFYAVASACVVPCLTSCVSSIHPESDRGAVAGVFRSLGALARAFGPIVASTLYWLMGPHVSYTVGGILLLAPMLLLKKVANPQLKKL